MTLSAYEPVDPEPAVGSRGQRVLEWFRANAESLGLVATLAAIALYTLVFSVLTVRNFRYYGNWAFDMAIYDQAFWLVSQFGDTFMTVRGMDVWGHHVTLIAYLFAPFYWLGVGPEALLVAQSFGLALGALPVYLIARHRLGRPAPGFLFAAVYLMYAPLQNINWRDFHPEALVIAPFLFAWYCALRKRWGWYFVCLVIAMAMREDTALAVIMLGVVLAVVNRHSDQRRRDMKVAAGTFALGVAWYLVATQLVIPHFNQGDSAFYLRFFYGRWGGSFTGIVENMVRHPNRVLSDAVQHDRLTFYKQLLAPLAGLPLLAPLHLLMAFPQLLASVIGDSPYARTILYQYTSIMVAPIMIAAVEGFRKLWRLDWRVRSVTVVVLIFASYASNIAWSTSPISDRYYASWSNAAMNPRRAAFDEAVALVPEGASVTSSYGFGPHLARRRLAFDWPNPFWPSFWGNEVPSQADCRNFPSASVVDYLVLDMALFAGDPNVTLFIDTITGPDGDFEVVDEDLLESSQVLVARRTRPGPAGEPLPPNCSDAFPRPPTGPGTMTEMLAQYQAATLVLPGEEPPADTSPADTATG